MIRDEVERIASEFSKLFASRDVDALVDMYDDEAKLLAPGAPLIEGRPGVRLLLEALFAQGARALEFETGHVFESGALKLLVDAFNSDTPS